MKLLNDLFSTDYGLMSISALVREQIIEPLDKYGRVYRVLQPDLLCAA